MPKIKIKDWAGIHTNLDQNDTRLEAVRDSTNFKFKKGYAEFEPRLLNEYTLPDLSVDFPQDFTFETGIYCTLTNDPLNNVDDEEAWKKDCLVIIAKAADPGKAWGWNYHRLVYIKNFTDDDPWYELSAKSNYATYPHTIRLYNHNGSGGFTKGGDDLAYNSFLSTNLDGDAFFQLEKGTLKIYLPHDAFKLQWIKRECTDDSVWLDYDGWCLDKLVEPYLEARANVRVQTVAGWSDMNSVPVTVPPLGPPNVRCASGRRLGVKFTVETIEDETLNLDERITTVTTPGSYQIWYNKHNFAEMGFRLYLYQFADLETAEQIYHGYANEHWIDNFNPPGTEMGDGIWPFYESLTWGTHMVVPGVLAGFLQPQGTTWTAIGGEHGTWNLKVTEGTATASNAWRISKATFDAQTWVYKGTSSTIGESGFIVATDKKYSIIATAVLDDREEVVVEMLNGEAIFVSPGTRFALKIKDIYIAYNQNPRVTRLRFYHKVQDIDADYVLHHEVDILEGIKPPNRSFFMSEYSDSGTSLSGNIGYLFDWENPNRYDVLEGFKSFTTESGVSIGVTTYDTVNLYHSTVGGGSLMADLVYDANQLPITGINNIRAVCNVNGKIAAFTDTKLYIISTAESLGQLVFSVDDTMDLGVKNFNDIASIQGGAVANTRNGIFITDGFSQKLISEPINDVAKENFDTSQIFYNTHKHELYLKPTAAEDLYRYRFEDAVWEKINATVTSGDATQSGEEAAEVE
jgi:hypothetical protein